METDNAGWRRTGDTGESGESGKSGPLSHPLSLRDQRLVRRSLDTTPVTSKRIDN